MAFHRRSFRNVSIQQESLGEHASQVCAANTVQMSVGQTQVAENGVEARNAAETGPLAAQFR